MFTYYTDVFSGEYNLNDAVDALNAQLELDEVLNSGRLVFVCHSMGGLVARKFVVDRVLDLKRRNTRIGLFLVASPSLGAEYADWLSGIAGWLGHAQAEALRFVRNNQWLYDLNKQFRNIKESGELQIHGKEIIEDKFVVLKRFWRRQVVEPFGGAVFFGDPVKIPKSDHFTICKPKDRSDLQHRLLCQFIAQELHRKSEAVPKTEAPPGSEPAHKDKDAIAFFQRCFDRPAFKTPFYKEVSQENFIQAIEDTITALNTGTLLHRTDRTVLSKGLPRNNIENRDWRLNLTSIEQNLQQIRHVYETSVKQGATRIFEYQGHYYMPDQDKTAGPKIDQLRLRALDTLNRICREAEVDTIETSKEDR